MNRLPFKNHALIGMIHLEALPGSPDYAGDMKAVADKAVREAKILQKTGFDAIMIENFYDAPFFKSEVPPETIAALTRCAYLVKDAVPELPLGINVLRNDALSALGIAVSVGAEFIRVNILTGAMVTDQGIIEGSAAELLRKRRLLDPSIAILADVDVKHAAPLAQLDPAQSAKDVYSRGHADALIVSGTGTGQPTSPETLESVHAAVPEAPILIGSGITPENIGAYASASAFIIGTCLKEGRELKESRCLRMVGNARALFSSK